jgi:hypothetical protein
MKKLEDAALEQPPRYLLSEEGREQLELLRDHLFMMSTCVFAATLEEENTPLEVRRSLMGKLFESFGLRIDDIITCLDWPGRKLERSTQRH